MGQVEILKILETAGEPLCCREIAERAGTNKNNTARYLSKLAKYGEVKVRKLDKYTIYWLK